ncbi:hypothetical protein [Shewanella sp.]|uniref:hypothetical protein n=1 Tax=Shewanella sp. TaxID=50422 RepID=UPI0040487897
MHKPILKIQLMHANFWGALPELIDRAMQVGRSLNFPVRKANERLVRYYTSEGVIDKPDRLGREAAYHSRHLVQLVTALRLTECKVPLAIVAWHNKRTNNDGLFQGLTDEPLAYSESVKRAFHDGSINTKSLPATAEITAKSISADEFHRLTQQLVESQLQAENVMKGAMSLIEQGKERQGEFADAAFRALYEATARSERPSDWFVDFNGEQIKLWKNVTQEVTQLKHEFHHLIDVVRALQLNVAGLEKAIKGLSESPETHSSVKTKIKEV